MMSNGRNLVIAVKGVIVQDGKMLLVQRAPHDYVGAGTWECAGGKIEWGEGLEEALVREILEETGLTVTVGSILYASTFMTDPTRQVVILTYLCRTDQTTVRLSNEHVDYLWGTEEQIKKLLLPQILSDFESNHVFSHFKQIM